MAEHGPLRVVVLVSGTGSNLRKLVAKSNDADARFRVVAVVSDRADAGGLAFAEEQHIPTTVVRPKAHASREAWDAALANAVANHGPDLVVLAGFMRILGAAMITRFASRIINVHPSLLPRFPGHDGPAQAVRAGVGESGCTVHVVDAGVDTGPILAQATVPVAKGDDAASLHARIQQVEYVLFPFVVSAIAHGALTLGIKPEWHAVPPNAPPSLIVPNPASSS